MSEENDALAQRSWELAIQRNPDAILVAAELNEGDAIATEGLQRVLEGGAVRIAG